MIPSVYYLKKFSSVFCKLELSISDMAMGNLEHVLQFVSEIPAFVSQGQTLTKCLFQVLDPETVNIQS